MAQEHLFAIFSNTSYPDSAKPHILQYAIQHVLSSPRDLFAPLSKGDNFLHLIATNSFLPTYHAFLWSLTRDPHFQQHRADYLNAFNETNEAGLTPMQLVENNPTYASVFKQVKQTLEKNVEVGAEQKGGMQLTDVNFIEERQSEDIGATSFGGKVSDLALNRELLPAEINKFDDIKPSDEQEMNGDDVVENDSAENTAANTVEEASAMSYIGGNPEAHDYYLNVIDNYASSLDSLHEQSLQEPHSIDQVDASAIDAALLHDPNAEAPADAAADAPLMDVQGNALDSGVDASAVFNDASQNVNVLDDAINTEIDTQSMSADVMTGGYQRRAERMASMVAPSRVPPPHKFTRKSLRRFIKDISKQSSMHHVRAVENIQEVMGVDEDEARIIKAGIYKYIRDNHPDLNNSQRAEKLFEMTQGKEAKKNIEMVHEYIEISRPFVMAVNKLRKEKMYKTEQSTTAKSDDDSSSSSDDDKTLESPTKLEAKKKKLKRLMRLI